jgi:hypothetical protein
MRHEIQTACVKLEVIIKMTGIESSDVYRKIGRERPVSIITL